MEELHDEYGEILLELISEAITCTPQTWTQGTLTIDTDGRSLNFKLKNDSDSGRAMVSEHLKFLCEDLYVAFRDNGEPWTAAVVHFYQDGDTWAFRSEYTYDTTKQKGA